MTSDTDGVASWQTASGGADDDWAYDSSGPGNKLYPFYDDMIIVFGSSFIYMIIILVYSDLKLKILMKICLIVELPIWSNELLN